MNKMRNRRSRCAAAVLAVCLTAALAPRALGTRESAGAADFFSGPAAGELSSIYQIVYFGENPAQDAAGAWRVLAVDDDEVFLLSETWVKVYRTTKDNLFFYGNWEERRWLTDAYPHSFTPVERAAVRPQRVLDEADRDLGSQTAVYDPQGDPFFLLSSEEVTDSRRFPRGSADRRMADGTSWWLRSPGDFDERNAAFIDGAGFVNLSGYGAALRDVGLRPACKLALSAVVFVSDAAGGKPSTAAAALSPVPAAPAGAVKLTLRDDALQAPHLTLAGASNPSETIRFAYRGAPAGAGRYLACTLANSEGRVVFYGRLADCRDTADGTLRIPMRGVGDGRYLLSIFSEWDRGPYATDCAGEPVEMALSVLDGRGQVAYEGDTDPDAPALLLTPVDSEAAPGGAVTLSAAFDRQLDANVALLRCRFDGGRLSCEAFTPGDGVTVLDIDETADGQVRVVVMAPDYAMRELGHFRLRAGEGLTPAGDYEDVTLRVEYVVREAPDRKDLQTADAGAYVRIAAGEAAPGDTDGDGVVDLLDLSNVIDWFGADHLHPQWASLCVRFDSNGNGVIDIADIARVAKQIDAGS
jgi:hypothetical protein